MPNEPHRKEITEDELHNRDLRHLLGYAEWRNFNQTAISKVKTVCEVSGHAISDHFVDVNKMVAIGGMHCVSSALGSI